MGEDTDSEVSRNLVAGTVTKVVLESEPASQLELTDYLTTLLVLTVANSCPAFLSRYKDANLKSSNSVIKSRV